MEETLKLLKSLIPVFTLIIGFFLGVFKDWANSRRRLRNTRIMLKEELENINFQLSLFKAAKERGEEGHSIRSLGLGLCMVIRKLPIHDAHILQMNSLKKKELHTLLGAYFIIRNVATEFEIANIPKELLSPKEIPDAGVNTIDGGVISVLNSTNDAAKELEYHLLPWYRRWFTRRTEE